MTAPRTDTWMPLYVSDYIRDTRHLSTAEHGAYLLLLMHAWTNGGAIPTDDTRLARIAGLTAREWRSSKAVLLAFWSQADDGYRHKRVDQELAKAAGMVEQRSLAGKASAEARKAKREGNERSTAVATEGPTKPQRNARPSPSQDSLTTFESNAREPRLPPDLLDKVWSAAPPKARERSSRGDTSKALAAALKRGAKPDEIMAGLMAYWRSDDATKDGGAYAKGVHRMIADDRWRDWTSASLIPAGEQPDWPARLRIWRSTEQWHHTSWGPSPGYPTCQCPPELLTEAERRGLAPERPS